MGELSPAHRWCNIPILLIDPEKTRMKIARLRYRRFTTVGGCRIAESPTGCCKNRYWIRLVTVEQRRMNKRLALIVILFGSMLPASAQLKPLVVARTIPTTIKFEGYRNFALPSFCDEKRKSSSSNSFDS
jgi:hypothetical protein